MKSIRQSGWAAVFSCSVRRRRPHRQHPSKQCTIEQFLNTTSISGASFSADESRILFSSNKTGIWNLYSIPVTGGGGRRSPDRPRIPPTPSRFPKDDRILFTRDQGGNELNHLYVLKDGQERDLTPGEKLKAQFGGWTPDGRVLRRVERA